MVEIPFNHFVSQKKRKSFPLQNFVCEKKVIKYNWQVNLKLNGKSEKVLLAFNTKFLLHCNIEFSYHFFIHLDELLGSFQHMGTRF